jgi:hypothetical protein
VSAADVVPDDAVLVELVEDGHAVLVALAVVGLRAAGASGSGPGGLASRREVDSRVSPDPSIASPHSRGPDELETFLRNDVANETALGSTFQPHEIHAPLSAEVPGLVRPDPEPIFTPRIIVPAVAKRSMEPLIALPSSQGQKCG